MSQRQHFRDRTTDQPRDELDVAHSIVGPTNYEEVLQLVNLRTGYYEDEDLRLQMRSFRKGLVADVAFDGPLWERAVYETKIKLADEGFEYYDEEAEQIRTWYPIDDDRANLDDDLKEKGRTAMLRARGEAIWNDLAAPERALSDRQAAALAEKASLQPYKPVFWRLLAAYHEASASRGARTQDNFFGRERKHIVESADDADASSLLSRNDR